jgi:hypothetical protein
MVEPVDCQLELDPSRDEVNEGRVHRPEGSAFLFARYHLTSPSR